MWIVLSRWNLLFECMVHRRLCGDWNPLILKSKMADNQGRIMVPPGPEAWKRLRARGTYISNIDLILVLFLLLPSLLINVVLSWSELWQNGWTDRAAAWQKFYKRPQIFSLEISGPKVVILCQFSLYRAVRGPLSRPGPWGFSLTSLMDDPALRTVPKFERLIYYNSAADCILWLR